MVVVGSSAHMPRSRQQSEAVSLSQISPQRQQPKDQVCNPFSVGLLMNRRLDPHTVMLAFILSPPAVRLDEKWRGHLLVAATSSLQS